MANQSLIADLLKTPSQIRKEREERLLTEGLAQAQLFNQGNRLGGVGGMFAGFGAAQAANVGRGMDQAVTALRDAASSATGQDFRRGEERVAAEQQKVLRGTDTTNLQSLKTRRQMFVDAGAPPQALEAIDRQIMALEDKRKAEMAARSQAQSEAQQQQFENQMAVQELALEAGQLENVLGVDVSEATVESQAKARTIISNGPTEGETPAEMLNRARQTLKTLDKSSKTTVNVGEGEGAFAKELGKKDAQAFTESETQMDNVDRSLNVLQEGKQILSEGIISGFGAGVRLDFERAKKLFNMTDATEDELIARTETYQKNMANATLAILGSGDLGAGTGLSDKDREFAQDVVAGNISLDEQSLRRIIEINEKANVYRVRQHNNLVARNNKRYNSNLPMRYYEGQTATGPNNEEMVYRGGAWEQIK
jgi:hypothetical protein